MNARTVRDRVNDLEDGLTERKRGFQGKDEIRKAVVSFANSVPDGHTAVLYFGLGDDGVVVGVSPSDAENIQQHVRRICEEDCFPTIAIRLVEVIEVDAKHVVAFEFAPSSNKPHFAGHAFIRVGSASVRASASKFDELVASRNTAAGRLLAAKDRQEILTLILPAGASIAGGSPLARRRELECKVHECDAHHVKFYDLGEMRYVPLSLQLLSFSWDYNRNRLLVEYTRAGGTLMMGVVRE